MTALTLPGQAMRMHLRLGRVSNLPTVWSNAIAGIVLAGGFVSVGHTLGVLVGLSLFYVGGMYLNDAFDRQIDARERPDRPIPSGQIKASTVYSLGFGMLGIGVLGLATLGAQVALVALALAATVVLYDARHKGNVLSPVLMGLCRALVYLTAGAAAGGSLALPLLLGALAVWAHVVGLTYAAKQESLDRIGALWPLAILAIPLALYASAAIASPTAALAWLALAAAAIWAVKLLAARKSRGDVPRAVVQLIAAISLLDALVVASAGGPQVAFVACLGAYVLTRLLQAVIPGT